MNCNACGGELGLLGGLGNMVWFRCTCCGHEQGHTTSEIEELFPELLEQEIGVEL